MNDLSHDVGNRGGDVIYGLDVHAEDAVLEYCAEWSKDVCLVLVMEGMPAPYTVLPDGASLDQSRFTLIVDPVDGTRGLMYGKRSAWVLCGVAPPPRPGFWPGLGDIGVALQMELPTPRAAVADVLWAVRGDGVHAETVDLRDGEVRGYVPSPSTALTIRGGFATVCKFFPGVKVAASEMEERLFSALLGEGDGQPEVFDDEYICSGGQLYELAVGHDRFVADLRPLLAKGGQSGTVLTAHPYDLCTWIIAAEAGVVVTGGDDEPLSAPLDTTTSVSWIGYANGELYEAISPVLMGLLREDEKSSRSR
jgi:hypothetical protein